MDQDYLFDTLAAAGFEEEWITLFNKFYSQNKQHIGEQHFDAKSGIRQGCPLSPLLFAIVADLLLRKLAENYPEATIKAFADDTAMVIDDSSFA